MIPVENALQIPDFSKRRNETDGKEYRSVRVGGMSESSYGTATMECFKREKLGNYTVLFVGPWTPDKLRAIGEFCRKENMRFVMDEMMNRLTGEFTPSYLPVKKRFLRFLRNTAMCWTVLC